VKERTLENGEDSFDWGKEKSDNAWPYYLQELDSLTLARLHIAQNHAQEALKVLQYPLNMAVKFQRTGVEIEIHIVQALSYQSLGRIEQAVASIQKALTLAEPEGYIRLFVDEGQPMARLLYEVEARKIALEYTGKLLATFSVNPSVSAVQKQQTALIETLGRREIEVLNLIAEGLSNKEIASQLNLSEHTVNSHIGNILKKLHLANRTQAALYALREGIVDLEGDHG
jgi:LuxR family maltose regulon positive regulatory protein